MAAEIAMKEMHRDRIKVLVVDDSAFMRTALRKMLESDPGIQVVDTSRDGEHDIEKIQRLRPDVVTLDVEMLRMNGLEALRRIMAEMPLPVIMVSSVTKRARRRPSTPSTLGQWIFSLSSFLTARWTLSR